MTLIYFLIVIICPLCSTTQPKLNLPRILLPIFRETSTEFTLEVSGGGCYKWYVSRSDLVLLKPKEHNAEEDCSTSASLIVLNKILTRNVAMVIAEDIVTQHILRADVIVDVIASLDIVTTTRELYIEEPPELFEVRAYDAQGNEFTTLHGIEFKWVIHRNMKETVPVFKFMTFCESHYETPSSIVDLESRGRQGHIILLEGIRTGTSTLSVHLPYDDYKHIQHSEVSLCVKANLILAPNEVYVLKGDVVTFRLKQMSKGRLIDFDLPGSHYYLVSENDTIVSVQNIFGQANNLGRVRILLHDKNNAVEKIPKLPEAQVTVAEPFYATLRMFPYNTWVLVSLQYAWFEAEIYNNDHQKFHLGPNARAKIIVSQNLFRTINMTTNGTVMYGYGNKPGIGDVSITFLGISNNTLDKRIIFTKKVISAKSTLKVYPRIDLIPAKLVLPWHPVYSRNFKLQYNATGGDGFYLWLSTNKLVASITQGGVVKLTGQGETKIIVSMKQDNTVKADSSIVVAEPFRIEILDHINEAEIGHLIFINVIVYGRLVKNSMLPLVKFSQCNYLSFKIEITGHFFQSSLTKNRPIGEACHVVSVMSKVPGVSKVTISYTGLTSILSATTHVEAFKPLTPLFPELGNPVVLAVGSSSQLVFQNGPQPGQSKELNSIVEANDSVIRHWKLKEKQDLYVYSVVCIALGKSDFSLFIYSKPLDCLCKKTQVISTVKVICSSPHILKLEADHPQICPIKSFDLGFASRSNKFKVFAIIKDRNGNIFNNASSLKFNWIVEKTDMAFFENVDSIQLTNRMEPDYLLPLKHYKLVYTRNITGFVSISSKIVGYRKPVLRRLGINSDWIGNPNTLHNSITLKVVDNITIEPSALEVFNHPYVKRSFIVSYGSGHYNYEVSPESLATIEQDKLKLFLIPKCDGHGFVIVRDSCVVGPPVIISVKIVRLFKINLDVPTQVEKGKKYSANVTLLGKDGEVLDFQRLTNEEFNLSVKSGNEAIIKIIAEYFKLATNSTTTMGFYLQGLSLGETTIVAKYLGVSSDVCIIQVFQPLTVSPRSLTMTVGSEIQVTVLGGPSATSCLQFSHINTSIISVSAIGVVKGIRLGHSSLKVLAVGSNGQIFSEDTIEVKVIQLTGVKIVSPITSLLVDNVMPIWASGIPNQLNPLILGSVSPSLKFIWSVSMPSIIQLRDVLQDTNIEVINEDKLTMRLKGLKPGYSQVFLSVSGKSGNDTFLYNCSLEVQVLKKFHWTHPFIENSPNILIPTNSKIQVQSNMDKDNAPQYKVINVIPHQDGKIRSSTSNFAQKANDIVVMEQSGLVKSSNIFGNAIIFAKIQDDIAIKQSVILNVMVKQVYFIMINVFNKLKISGNVLQTLPQGLCLDINVTYHDEFGSVFHSVPALIEIKPSASKRINYAQKCSSIFSVILENPGQVTLRIAEVSSTQSMEDFVKIPVSNHIFPSKSYLSLNEIVCFSMLSKSRSGLWNSENDVVTIDKNGVAYAAKLGSAVITYSLDEANSKIYTSFSVEVLPTKSVRFILPSIEMITNSFIGAKYTIPVQLVNEKTPANNLAEFQQQDCQDSPLLWKDPPIKCEIYFNNILSWAPPISHLFTVKSIFDRKSGSYVCEITSLSGPSYNASLITANITLKVNLPLPTSKMLEFKAAIYLITKNLYFRAGHRVNYLLLSGTDEVLRQVVIEPSNTIAFTVLDPNVYKDHFSFPVRLDNFFEAQQDSQYYITVHSQLTKQNIQVPILMDERAVEHLTYKCVNEYSSFLDNINYYIDFSYFSIHNLLHFAIFSIALTFTIISYNFLQRAIEDSGEFIFSPHRRRQSSTHIKRYLGQRRNLKDCQYITPPREHSR